jgi:hypothetical protein
MHGVSREATLAHQIRLTIAATAIACLVFVPAAAASQPAVVEMVFLQNANTYDNLGWTSTGTIVDSGDWEVTRLVFGSPKTLLFGDVDSIQTSSRGSFRLQWHGGTTPAGGVAATWRMTDGTGFYAGMRGEGRWTQTWSGDFLVFQLWGTVHRDPSA